MKSTQTSQKLPTWLQLKILMTNRTRLMRGHGLTVTDFTVLSDLVENPINHYSVSHQELAEGMNLNKDTVRRSLYKLRDKKLVHVRVNEGYHGSNVYEVITPFVTEPDFNHPNRARLSAICKALNIPLPEVGCDHGSQGGWDQGSQGVGSLITGGVGSTITPIKDYIEDQLVSNKQGQFPDEQEPTCNQTIVFSPESQEEEIEVVMKSTDVIKNLNQGKSTLKKAKGKARHTTRLNTRAASTLALKTLSSLLREKDPSKAHPHINDMHMNKLANLAKRLGKNGKANWMALVKLIAFSCRHWQDYCEASGKSHHHNPKPNLTGMTTYLTLDAMEIVAKKRYNEYQDYKHTLYDGAVSTKVCMAEELEHKPVTKIGSAPNKAPSKTIGKTIGKAKAPVKPEPAQEVEDTHTPDKWDLALAAFDAEHEQAQ